MLEDSDNSDLEDDIEGHGIDNFDEEDYQSDTTGTESGHEDEEFEN